MRELLASTQGGALIIARYNDYMYLLYYNLAERLGGASVFLGYEVGVPDIVAYVRDDQPLYLAPCAGGLRPVCRSTPLNSTGDPS